MSAAKLLSTFLLELNGLSGAPLRDKAIAANNIRFVESLLQAGLSPLQVEALFRAIAERLVEDGQRPPTLGLYNYAHLLLQDPGFEPG